MNIDSAKRPPPTVFPIAPQCSAAGCEARPTKISVSVQATTLMLGYWCDVHVSRVRGQSQKAEEA